MVTLWATPLLEGGITPRGAAWYGKSSLTFSDAIASVRRSLWLSNNFGASDHCANQQKFAGDLAIRMADALCYAA